MRFKALIMSLCFAPVVSIAAMTDAQRQEGFRNLQWRAGPSTEAVAGKATLRTPSENVIFLDAANSNKFLELTNNIPGGENFIVIDKQNDWWADFHFNPTGYVKDDEKIDADAILNTLKASDGPANDERKRRGIPPLYTEGWYIPPHYDHQTKRLEWGVKLRSEGQVALNYTIRLLGRTGVMNATLVSGPQTLDKDVANFKEVLKGFEFNSGERYSEFKQGDHIAEYGLGALIVGGAAAVATKKGFWGAIAAFLAAAWKFVAAAIIAAFAGIRALFKRKEN